MYKVEKENSKSVIRDNKKNVNSPGQDSSKIMNLISCFLYSIYNQRKINSEFVSEVCVPEIQTW